MSISDVRTIRSNDKLMDELDTIVKNYNRKTKRFAGATSSPDEIYDGLKNRLSKGARTRVFLCGAAHKVLSEKMANTVGKAIYDFPPRIRIFMYGVAYKVLPNKMAKFVGNKIYSVFGPRSPKSSSRPVNNIPYASMTLPDKDQKEE